jgi:hypothetical protein
MLYSAKERAISIDLITRLIYELCDSGLSNSLMLHPIKYNEKRKTGMIYQGTTSTKIKKGAILTTPG